MSRRWHSASGGVEQTHTDGCLGECGYGDNRHHQCDSVFITTITFTITMTIVVTIIIENIIIAIVRA